MSSEQMPQAESSLQPASDVVITVKGLTKRYEIYAEPQHRLKQMLLPRLRQMFGAPAVQYYRDFWALRDVSFNVHRGEAIGIIGRNGSGKSTLLQMICGILTPTAGTITSPARIAALLELGAGFNPEFTGKENIFLSGLVYGIPESVLKQRYQDIVDFAEIGDHIDQPVKTYSSGMYVRLAFAVASFSDPEILVIDEALSVGDVYFQRKCFRRIDELREAGCTLLFVTHSVDTLLQLCDRGIVLDSGRLVFDGPTKPAVAEYLRRVFGNRSTVQGLGNVAAAEEAKSLPSEGDAEKSDHGDDYDYLVAGGQQELFASRAGYNRGEVRLGDGAATLLDFLIKGQRGESPIVHSRESFGLMLKYVFSRPSERVIFGMQVRTREGLVVYSANTFTVENELYSYAADDVVIVEFDLRNSLLPGQYFLTVGVSQFDEQGADIGTLDRRVDSIILTVLGDKRHTNGFADMELVSKVSLTAPTHPAS
ncbi:ABC transporter ATP-binding protein [Rhodanobacter sp. L36]|uniref:ABC transporter ATP-binding protein n=1 Tax=Rhodanobacter sp. L36 TaxID=1747221 RepID=UPI00131CA324|nr:ABC transporter ATP-binding protein [Rhodanobacter sp. L36]